MSKETMMISSTRVRHSQQRPGFQQSDNLRLGASITQMDSDSETKDGKILQYNRLQLHCSLCRWETGLLKPFKARQKIMDHGFKHLHTNGLDEVHTEISEETDSHDNIADQKIPSTDNVLEETPEIENYIQKIYNIKNLQIKRKAWRSR